MFPLLRVHFFHLISQQLSKDCHPPEWTPLTLPFVFPHFPVNHSKFLTSVKPIREAQTRNWTSCVRLLLNRWCSSSITWVSMQRGTFNHSTHYALSKGHISVGISQSIKHISCFFWDVPLGIYWESWTVSLLRLRSLCRGFYPVHQTRCPFGYHLLCDWINTASCDCAVGSRVLC